MNHPTIVAAIAGILLALALGFTLGILLRPASVNPLPVNVGTEATT